MRRSGHPSRPRAITCCFFASLKTLLISTKAICLTPKSTSRASFSLAGFQVTIIGRFWVTAGEEVSKGVSIGIALASQGSSAENLVQNADMAMYRAKSKGKGRTELFDATMHKQVMGQLQLELRLGRALQNGELELYYQPIVAIQSGLIEGFEALLRWRPADSDSVSPGVFIPIAERSGLIVPISSWVLTTGCLEAVSWHRRCPDEPSLYVSINISARHFSHATFIGHVREALEQSGISPACVKIELTESVTMNDTPSTQQTMSQMRALCVTLSIDDLR